MPLYEYQCMNCGEEFEQVVRFSEADIPPNCPKCGTQETKKQISATASLGSSISGSSNASSSCAPRGGFT